MVLKSDFQIRRYYAYIWKKNSDTTLQYVYFSLIFHLLFTQG